MKLLCIVIDSSSIATHVYYHDYYFICMTSGLVVISCVSCCMHRCVWILIFQIYCFGNPCNSNRSSFMFSL